MGGLLVLVQHLMDGAYPGSGIAFGKDLCIGGA